MKRRFTPEKIDELAPGNVFVFGSNLSGYHVGGAAKYAVQHFGSVYGRREGLQGQSYAIPTMLPTVDMIRPYVERFIKFARKNEGLTFWVTPIGCGEAGFIPWDIAPLFMDALECDNIILPESFVEVILHQPRYMGIPMNSWDSYRDFTEKKKTFENSILHGKEGYRNLLIKVFHNTVQIANTGFYITEKGNRVELPSSESMKRNTVFYSEQFSVGNVPTLDSDTIVEVTERDCLKESVRLSKEGYSPAVLNMASRQVAGGGVLKGSRAQEESIFRRTNLFQSLYSFVRFGDLYGVKKSERQYPMDPDFGGIYSPNVVYIRDSERNGCRLLENPEYVSVISVAAMNRPRLTSDGLIVDSLVEGVKNKIRTVFRIALRHRHDSLVLGAWGCGAFCNPPRHMARLFHEVMREREFKNKFKKIVFAIIEDHNSRKAHNPEGNLLPFQREFQIYP